MTSPSPHNGSPDYASRRPRPRPQILFLDAHDSFSNNITALLSTLLHADVAVIPIDAPFARVDFLAELQCYDAVVCGPGPGSPDDAVDVGLMRAVWRIGDQGFPPVPVLGVCLGFQALAREFGGSVQRLNRGLHGMVTDVEHSGGDVFSGVPPFAATLYHSLCANIGQADVAGSEWAEKRWQPLPRCPDLVPLAWARSEDDERILMAARHARWPLWAVQYHPESVCTDGASEGVIRNWFEMATQWNLTSGRCRAKGKRGGAEPVRASPARRASYLQRLRAPGQGLAGEPWNGILGAERSRACYACRVLDLPMHVAAPEIVEILGREGQELIVLDSSSAKLGRLSQDMQDQKGRYSIVVLDAATALRVEYRVGSAKVTLRRPGFAGDGGVDRVEDVTLRDGQDAWMVLSRILDTRRQGRAPGHADGADVEGDALPGGASRKRAEVDIPFRGGFVGYVTYEMGLEGIGIKVGDRTHARPDLCMVWATRSVVLDHATGRVVVQGWGDGRAETDAWVRLVSSRLQESRLWTHDMRNGDASLPSLPSLPSPRPSPPQPPPLPTRHLPQLDLRRRLKITKPDAQWYQGLVDQCKEFIAAGHSYELCLTAQTTISFEPGATGRVPSAWRIFRALRARQPVPFGSFVRLGPATLVSSSPERFLSHSEGGLCRMHPMKGTVRKVRPGGERVPREEAEAVLQTPKERAENLMIVDLVRHDLHGVCGAGNVTVPVLMRVEEYESVFQMVTVVEGQLARGSEPTTNGVGNDDGSDNGRDDEGHYTGLDVLAAALPPGSMTGAPKRRSCEILQGLEGGVERSLYSGVVGYIDGSTGRGDWSVTIRSLFRWDDEQRDEGEAWRVGAGGAVTGLSSAEGEWEEMLTKLAGPLGIFGDE